MGGGLSCELRNAGFPVSAAENVMEVDDAQPVPVVLVWQAVSAFRRILQMGDSTKCTAVNRHCWAVGQPSSVAAIARMPH